MLRSESLQLSLPGLVENRRRRKRPPLPAETVAWVAAQEREHRCRLINLTGGKFAKVSREDFKRINAHKWYCSTFGYAIRFINRNVHKICILMHREILRTPDGMETDHVNMDKLDNRRENLRLCNKRQNQGNRNGSRYTTKTSSFKGVRWHKRHSVWEAYITRGGRYQYLGSFIDEISAASAYNAAALQHFGQFARLNPV